MSTEDAPLPTAPHVAGPPPHLLLVRAPYYRGVIDGMTNGATHILREASATFEQLDVAGAFELPQAIRIAMRGSQRFDGFIALGCVVRGETDHYEFLCRAAMEGMMQVALQFGLALGTGLLTCDTLAQAEARSRYRRSQQRRGGSRGRIVADRCGASPRRGLMGRSPRRPRTASRVAAVQALFQSEQAQDNPETVIDQFVRHRLGELPGTGGFEDGRVPDAEVPLFARIVRAAVAQQDTIDRMLAEALPADWPLARIDPVLRALMRAGTAELAMADGPPAKVVINEYLDVARSFFTGAEPGMANAMLDRLARLLRPGEFE